MVCSSAHPAQRRFLPNGEYVIRLLGDGVGQADHSSSPLLTAEILEGDHDGRRIAFDVAAEVKQRFTHSRELRALAAHGACCMVKVAVRTDSAGHCTCVITRLTFLGYEPAGLADCDLN